MIDVTKYRGQRVAVFGLGKSGTSAMRALKTGGATVMGWDDNQASREALVAEHRPEYVAHALHKHLAAPEGYPWAKVKALVLSPGVPLTHPVPHHVVMMAKDAACPVICDIELLYYTCPRASYIGVTGTNGKSTTTSLIGHILKTAKVRTEIGGNLGTPVLTLEPLAADGVYVLELSSYQLDLLDTTHIGISVLLNITPDHLDRHGDMEGYITAKKRIFRHQGAEDTAVIGVDNPHTAAIYEELVGEANIGRIIPVSTEKRVPGGVSVIQGVLYNDIGKEAEIIELGALKNLAGKHNGENIAAAFASCYARNIKTATIVKAIRSFAGLQHRLQYIAEIEGVAFVNDSKATNAEAAEKALLSYENIYWIAGGKAKEGGIEALAHCFPRVKHAFLIGDAEAEFAATLQGKVPFSHCGDLANAFKAASAMALADNQEKSVVMLAPACASFDQWANFEQRGDAFVLMVKELNKERAGS